MIDDKELQQALSSYNQSFSLRTVHLLMYLFTNTNVRKIGMPITEANSPDLWFFFSFHVLQEPRRQQGAEEWDREGVSPL
jgi:spore coat protein CotF